MVFWNKFPFHYQGIGTLDHQALLVISEAVVQISKLPSFHSQLHKAAQTPDTSKHIIHKANSVIIHVVATAIIHISQMTRKDLPSFKVLSGDSE